MRDPDDYYTTPSWCVRRLLDAWKPRPGILVEPSAGNGAIIRAFSAVIPGRDWVAIERREEEARSLLQTGAVASIDDFLVDEGGAARAAARLRVSAVIGNPPYSHAWQFVHEARRRFPGADVCYLLRLAFVATADRAPFMRECPPDVYVLPDRPSFTGEGGDSADYGWFVWPPVVARGAGALRVLAVTPLAERQLDRGHRVVVEPPQRSLFG